MVSICSITYNHEKYITHAIDSWLMQKTDFNFEIIIADDASKDNNQEIIRRYQNRNPGKIKAILRAKNVGMQKNFINALINCKGKYIALCEGDDYWTDPYKLQKQVDFLEANPDYGLVYSNITLIDKNGDLIKDLQSYKINKTKYKSGYILFNLFERSFINTCTVCVRNEIMQELVIDIEKNNKWYVYDRWFWLQVARQSMIKYIDQKMAKYRVHSAGLSLSKNDHSYRLRKVPYIVIDTISSIDKNIVNTKRKKNILANQLLGLLFRKDVNIVIKFKAMLLLLKYMPSYSLLMRKFNNKFKWK